MIYPSAFIITVANLLPLGLAWSGRWEAREVLIAYWWLGLLLAISTLVKISIIRSNATAKVRSEFDVMDLPVWAYVPIVLGGSMLMLWVIHVLASDTASFFTGTAWQVSWRELVADLGDPLVWWFVIVLSLRFSYSLYRNFYQQREFQRSRMLLERAIIRISCIEVVSVVVVAGSLSLDNFPLWVATALIGLTDVLFHLVERAVGHKVDHPSVTDYGRGS